MHKKTDYSHSALQVCNGKLSVCYNPEEREQTPMFWPSSLDLCYQTEGAVPIGQQGVELNLLSVSIRKTREILNLDLTRLLPNKYE
jgi:hypothetical protein